MVLINNNTRLLSCIIERPSDSTDKQSTFHIVWKVDFNQPCPSHHDGILTGEPPLLCLCCCQREAASWFFFFFYKQLFKWKRQKHFWHFVCPPPSRGVAGDIRWQIQVREPGGPLLWLPWVDTVNESLFGSPHQSLCSCSASRQLPRQSAPRTLTGADAML